MNSFDFFSSSNTLLESTQLPLEKKKVFDIPLSSPNFDVSLLISPKEPAWQTQFRFNRVALCWFVSICNPQNNRSIVTPLFPQQLVFGPLGCSFLEISWDWTCFFPQSLVPDFLSDQKSSLILVMQ